MWFNRVVWLHFRFDGQSGLDPLIDRSVIDCTPEYALCTSRIINVPKVT